MSKVTQRCNEHPEFGTMTLLYIYILLDTFLITFILNYIFKESNRMVLCLWRKLLGDLGSQSS